MVVKTGFLWKAKGRDKENEIILIIRKNFEFLRAMLEGRGKFPGGLPSPQVPNSHLLSPSVTFLLPDPGAGVMGARQVQVPVGSCPLQNGGVKSAVLNPQ